MKIIPIIKYYVSASLIPLYVISIIIPLIIYGRAVNADYQWGTYLVLFIVGYFILNQKQICVPSKLIKYTKYFSVLVLLSGANILLASNLQHSVIQTIGYSLVPYMLIIFSYRLCECNTKSEKYLVFYSFILLILGFYRYFRLEAVLDIIGREQASSNAFYYALMPLPCVLLSKNNIIKISGVSLAAIVCMLSGKRTAIIAVAFVIFLMIYQNIKTNKKIIILLFLASMVAFHYYGDSLLERLDYVTVRFQGIQDDGGSGRTDLYSNFWKDDINDLFSFPEAFIGEGFRGFSRKHNGIETVHNDYLEMLYSYGILGFIYMIYLLLYFIKKIKLMKYMPDIRNAYCCFLFLFIMYSMTGGVFSFIYSSIPLYLFIGISEHKFKQYETNRFL